jgi:cysteinyl-tRNA synthetase
LRAIEKDQKLSPNEKRAIFNFAEDVLALDLHRKMEVKPISDDQAELLKNREIARSEKNWSESDRLRDLLSAQGISVSDNPDGQSWNWIN